MKITTQPSCWVKVNTAVWSHSYKSLFTKCALLTLNMSLMKLVAPHMISCVRLFCNAVNCWQEMWHLKKSAYVRYCLYYTENVLHKYHYESRLILFLNQTSISYWKWKSFGWNLIKFPVNLISFVCLYQRKSFIFYVTYCKNNKLLYNVIKSRLWSSCEFPSAILLNMELYFINVYVYPKLWIFNI